jgi:NTP pyrophosphatase (non-canonical NTP hydrolase)
MLFAALALLLTAEPAMDPVRAELDKVASRIERLKGRQLAGEDVAPELERLLAEAQELAQRIERERARRGAAPPPPAAPGLPPEELKERADALRDEADRIAMQLRELDARIDAVRRERRVEAGLESLAQERSLFGDPGPSRAPTSGGSGSQPDAIGPQDVTIGPSAGGGTDETSQGTALQRIDRLRAERARLAARQAALEAEAVKLDAEARRTAGSR